MVILLKKASSGERKESRKSQFLLTAGSPSWAIRSPCSPIPVSGNFPQTLSHFSPPSRFSSPLAGRCHHHMAQGGLPRQKNHCLATTRATKPPHIWQTCRDFPSVRISAQLLCKRQKVELILYAWGSLLHEKYFIMKAHF